MSIKWDKEKVFLWYKREDVFKMITSFNDFKYYSFMSYDTQTGKGNPPRRFIMIIKKDRKNFDYILKYCSVFRQPTSMYRDVDCWDTSRPYFSLKKEEYKIEREKFFGKVGDNTYRKHIVSSDFIIDIDGENVYDSWECAFKVVMLLKKFGVMMSIYCSGKKGFQILIPHNKTIKKEYFMVGETEYNTHQALATNIQTYINDEKKQIDFSVYYDLRFVKQPYSLDGRNMCPIIPLDYNEFMNFIKFKGQQINPYMDIDNWLNKKGDFTKRGFNWWGYNNMNELDAFLDEHIERGLIK